MQVNEAFWNVYKINLNWYITHNMLVQAYVLFKALFCSVITDTGSFFVLHCLEVTLIEKSLFFTKQRTLWGKKPSFELIVFVFEIAVFYSLTRNTVTQYRKVIPSSLCLPLPGAVWLATQNHSTLVTETTVVPFLPVNPEYSSTRNQVCSLLNNVKQFLFNRRGILSNIVLFHDCTRVASACEEVKIVPDFPCPGVHSWII